MFNRERSKGQNRALSARSSSPHPCAQKHCCNRDFSDNEDDISFKSQMSRNSDDYRCTNNSVFVTSDSEAPVCVRDMIKLYNSASTRQDGVPAEKCNFFTSDKLDSQSTIKESLQDSVKDFIPICKPSSSNNVETKSCSCNGCNQKNSDGNVESTCIGSIPTMKVERANKTILTDSQGNQAIGMKIFTTKGQDHIVHTIENNGNEPIEAAYQSKTTIKKTESGVRIIIDIFFDKENVVDVIGSRVETDIPESRILSEFQQQANEYRTTAKKQ